MKVNYELEMQKELDKIGLNSQRKILIHSCCAPCSCAILEYLKNYFIVDIYFYNPNITEKEEYIVRLDEQKKFIDSMGWDINLIEGEYNPEKDFFNVSKGMEEEKEGGKRCYCCYKTRMEATAKKAKELGYDYFSTVLSISSLKNSNWINEIGIELEEKYGIKFLRGDFKKKGRYLRSTNLSKEHGLYRQDYCGCIFSKVESQKKREEREKLENEKKEIENIKCEKARIENTFIFRKKEYISLIFSVCIHLLIFFPMLNNLSIKGDNDEKGDTQVVSVHISDSNNIIGETKGFSQKQEKQIEKKKKENIEKKDKVDEKIIPLSERGEKVVEKDVVSDASIKEEEFKDGDSSENQKAQEAREESYEMGSNGERILKNQNVQGVEYKILNAPQPKYPSQAKKFNLGTVTIRTRFLVGKDGSVEKIEILEGREDFGFRKEIEKSVNQWRFSPIVYRGEVIKLYFYKEFVFTLEN